LATDPEHRSPDEALGVPPGYRRLTKHV